MEISNILIVDDEPSVIKALKRSFLDDPYKVYSAMSATEGLGILSANEIKVVISDEGMPGMSGADFLAKVRSSFPGRRQDDADRSRKSRCCDKSN